MIAQAVLGLQDVVNSIELRVDDIYLAPEIARQVESQVSKSLAATHWMEQNKPQDHELLRLRADAANLLGRPQPPTASKSRQARIDPGSRLINESN